MTNRNSLEVRLLPPSQVLRHSAAHQPTYTEGYAYGFEEVARGLPYNQELMDRGPVDRPRWKDFKPVDKWNDTDWFRFQEGYEQGRDSAMSFKIRGYALPTGWDVNKSWLPKSHADLLDNQPVEVRAFRMRGRAFGEEERRRVSRRLAGCNVDVIPDDAEDRVETY